VTGSSEAPPALPAGLTARPLAPADAALCFPLSAEAGWNQSEADWRFMLRQGEGIGVAAAGRLVGSAIALPFAAVAPHPPVAWISMVLVTPGQRGQGLATWMMRWAIERIAASGAVAVLDATPAGREVYRRLGFADGRQLVRLRAASGARSDHAPSPRVAATPVDVTELIARDRDIAAFDRAPVLRYLAAATPEAALVSRDGGRLGYALGRPGRNAFHIGPVVAEDAATALDLVAATIASRRGEPILIDAFADQAEFRAALERWGFAVERPYTRMHLGTEPGGDRRRSFAAAGPELG
jgi:GNAT superfamily N-acetyltransferase